MVQCLGGGSQIVALIAEMAGDKSRLGMLLKQPVAFGQKLFVRRHVLTVEIESLKVRRPLLMRPQRLPARRMVGNVQIHRYFQLGALLPKRCQASIIRMETFLARQIPGLTGRPTLRE